MENAKRIDESTSRPEKWNWLRCSTDYKRPRGRWNERRRERLRKFIVSLDYCIYNVIAKYSRERDLWRLSMLLSSFPVVERR
jgi:hypothetical protein